MASVSFEHVSKRKQYKAENKKNKPYHFKKKKAPLVLVFDEEAREDFLTGFRKRKLQRKKKATEDLEEQLKAERKRLRQEAKDALKKLVVSHRDIPELGQIYEDPDIVDMDTHEVKVTELDPDRLARENNWIGTNHAKVEESESESEESETNEPTDEIPGMETSSRKRRRLKKQKTKESEDLAKLKSKKDIKKYVKKVATKNVQKSKVFQKKKDIEARRNKKRKFREERNKEKMSKKVRNKRDKKHT